MGMQVRANIGDDAISRFKVLHRSRSRYVRGQANGRKHGDDTMSRFRDLNRSRDRHVPGTVNGCKQRWIKR